MFFSGILPISGLHTGECIQLNNYLDDVPAFKAKIDKLAAAGWASQRLRRNAMKIGETPQATKLQRPRQ